ncbi:F-box protein [Phytophthora cinnamomi]|uniref:F-box protein n=1 Tax=Phytophthora cinnamomi TaxID=4785 RepID=UPI00355AC69E|nr:F-box protein [Phytophthora cinnamomi]
MAAVKTEPSVRRVLELLVPRYTDAGDVSGSVPVSLDLSASLDVQLVFWERSGVAKELECVNFEEGCPRCKFESFLRGLVILKRRGVLHINGAYLVEGDFALLRLQIEGLADIGAASKLEEFDFVRSHLQLGDDARAGGSEKDRADAAKLSRCHVLGCTMHRWKASRPERAKASRPVQAVSPTSPRTSITNGGGVAAA